MTNNPTSSNGPQFRSGPLITSAALVGVGTFVVLTGLALGGSHLTMATRQWVRDMETPPTELAKLKYTQAKAAVAAGSAAWQNGTQVHPTGVS